MTSSNLAIVFGPNMVRNYNALNFIDKKTCKFIHIKIWARNDQMSLDEIGPINAFVDFVLQNKDDIYIFDINQKDILRD